MACEDLKIYSNLDLRNSDVKVKTVPLDDYSDRPATTKWIKDASINVLTNDVANKLKILSFIMNLVF